VDKRSRPVCGFLIPVVRDSDRKPHPPVLWRLLQDILLGTFGALSGPETVVYYRQAEPVPGAWSPGVGEQPIASLSRRYTVALPDDRVDALRALLRRAGNSFDQRAMYLEVRSSWRSAPRTVSWKSETAPGAGP
jgi:hypothetical protein